MDRVERENIEMQIASYHHNDVPSHGIIHNAVSIVREYRRNGGGTLKPVLDLRLN